ncbi:MAG TPA: hypothetical protein VHR39_19965 [Propionibacteriaceae bacterium]|jgi:hypothetical protein|nr:hypothetical protein [Propionibacteriaceae bacterium]
MFARTVRLVGLASPSEARLLGVVILTIVSLIFISTLVNPPHWLQLVALFVHLISLVVGFGSVLAVDWYGLLSLSRRVTIGDILLTAERMTPLIWIGLAGLTASGALLKPDLSSWLVVVKLCCVLGVGIVGVLSLATSRLMERQMPTPARSLIHRGMVLAGASQLFWWTAVVIGFVTNEAGS